MKRCKACKKGFEPGNTLQVVCSPACAIEYAKTDNGKKHRQKAVRDYTRKEKARIKSKSDWMREAQQAFNKFIRLRDADRPCISCGRHHQGQYHAGHFRSVGSAPELRFHEQNCWRQCAPCNNHLSGNQINYRIKLIERIGLEAVERLEGPHEPKRYTIEELKVIKQVYRAKARALE